MFIIYYTLVYIQLTYYFIDLIILKYNNRRKNIDIFNQLLGLMISSNHHEDIYYLSEIHNPSNNVYYSLTKCLKWVDRMEPQKAY